MTNKHGYDPKDFINQVPHMSFVHEKDINYLKERWNTMNKHHFYDEMVFSDSPSMIRDWAPLSMEGRSGEKVAATYIKGGTDVNFGELTRLLTHSLLESNVSIHIDCKVKDIKRDANNNWRIYFDSRHETRKYFVSKRVFIGAGGASLLLLEKTGIPQAKQYGGFPIRGEWLVCSDTYAINRHNVKMYGKPDLNAPPMSVSHLDTRIIDGRKQLLYGPCAGFSTKFLKNGSYMDLFKSIKYYNIYSMLKAGAHNIPLTKYLVEQLFLSFNDKVNNLRKYYPYAVAAHWELKIAGQRVQVIKKDKKRGGVLQFGTEPVVSDDGTISALLGASPGASTSVSIMIDIIEKAFKEMGSEEWIKKMRIMIPSYKGSMELDKDMYKQIHTFTDNSLKLI
jgi:malate dehydrogenase (quinone)